MFFRKKPTILNPTKAKKGIKKIDAVVTGLILGGLIASIYGIKKHRETKGDHIDDSHDMHDHQEDTDHNNDDHAPFTVPQKHQTKGLIRRLFFGDN